MRKKYALCVGNNYPGTNAQLSGCVNDANDWTNLLSGQGYEIETLLEATIAQARSRLRALVAEARFGDKIVWTFSGHGSWTYDGNADEIDGRDECFVMADYVNGGLLLDDEVQQIFGQARYGVGALIVADSCHSGTASRFATTFASEDATRKFLPPENFRADIEPAITDTLESETLTRPVNRTASLISGCGDLEYSYDAWFSGRANGALTKTALQSYLSGSSLNQWHRAIRGLLPSNRYPQTPELTATPYRKYTRAL